MKQPTLVILAAGMASRYGSLKQIQSFGPSGETIIEYSIYDAIRAGFKKVIFIIRKDFVEDFKEIFEPKLKGRIEVDYVFQELTAYTDGFDIPSERTKPFGTAQAILCCKGKIDGPFAVINADDFYGADAFQKAYAFLDAKVADNVYGSIAYKLKNTLSDNGSVSRGEIITNGDGQMTGIEERLKIYKKDGKIVFEDGDTETEMAPDTFVSMNFFCFDPSFVELCASEFQPFLEKNITDIKSEFLMPKVADTFIKEKNGIIDVIPTDAKWFGVTYKEDAPVVKKELDELLKAGVYPDNLWA
ncbi:nucleotidyltransferase family protein [Arachidicoccus terrestris]|uniref:nucleotidyltransferase family protein n=1 Tax=Arachidicoccus terrestris TaxID=2875539 RepID=UPI001CC59567|nr:sugar phosphate nucleotidyltransferase [Arachidicoccus terrestris]UAY54551.1 nucleotidyltransferase [Arachidicoccus terrestris]